MIINRPVAFQGTEEQRRANHATHDIHTYQFGEDDYESECVGCCCSPYGAVYDHPCGTEPREWFDTDTGISIPSTDNGILITQDIVVRLFEAKRELDRLAESVYDFNDAEREDH